MKKEIIINIATLLGVILFNILFWKEGMGLNVLLFTLFLIIGIWIKEKDIFKEKTMQIITLGTLGFAIMIIVNNSLYSKVLFVFSSILMIGIAQQRSIRFLGYALFLGFWSIAETPFKMWQNILLDHSVKLNFLKYWNTVKLFIIPSFIFAIFFIIYSIANQEFALLFIKRINDLFLFFFSLEISWARIVFSFIGLLIVGGAFWKNKYKHELIEGAEVLLREKGKKKLFPFTPVSLKNEYRIALITIVSLNLLLLMLNITDIQNVWLKDVGGMTVGELMRNVHQGTYVLIFSIIMAMAVVIYFFRRNINFYPNNNLLKIVSYIWIAQNAILALSVGLRNVRYIEQYGIAYKRVGVFIFLLLTLIGLFTMIIKVNKKKTVFYLVKRNAWVWYVVFWITAWVNWDIQITKYNLFSNYNGDLDVHFVTKVVSDKNIYLLEENDDILNERSTSWNSNQIQKALEIKKEKFLVRKEKHTCLSWNMADAKNIK